MKSLVEQINEKMNEISSKQNELELQQAELIVNQEYANCLLELNQTE